MPFTASGLRCSGHKARIKSEAAFTEASVLWRGQFTREGLYAGGSGGKVVRCDALRAPTPRSALPRLQSGRIPEDYLSLRKMWYSYEKNELIYITV